MAEKHEGEGGPQQDAAGDRRIQSGGRDANAARPLNAAPDRGGPERYPAVNRTDAVERGADGRQVPDEPRSFDPSADAASPREPGQGRLGPRGDPVEGKR